MITYLLWIFLIIIFLCWGSFLNVVGYRITHQASLLFPHSFCPNCRHNLAWFDLIPVISWLILFAQCRYCKHPISLLYPLIEITTAVALSALLILIDPQYWMSYFFFFSALIVTIRTDLETMLISRLTTLCLVPVAWFFASIGALPISLFDSIFGAFFGYFFLWIIAQTFYLIRKQQGIGEGDFDLLAMIGSFIGIFGAWFAICIGATIGSLIGIGILYKQKRNFYSIKIPFGPWLALGALLYACLSPYITHTLLF